MDQRSRELRKVPPEGSISPVSGIVFWFQAGRDRSSGLFQQPVSINLAEWHIYATSQIQTIFSLNATDSHL